MHTLLHHIHFHVCVCVWVRIFVRALGHWQEIMNGLLQKTDISYRVAPWPYGLTKVYSREEQTTARG
jgi:hypothetical protein